MTFKKTLLLILPLFILGCATSQYAVDGTSYKTKQEYQAAVALKENKEKTFALMLERINAIITPLDAPLSQENLVFAVPQASAVLAENIQKFKTKNSRNPNAIELQNIEKSSAYNYLMIKAFYQAVQRKNMYKNSQFLNLTNIDSTPTVRAGETLLYFTKSSGDVGRWFYAPAGSEKQIFQFDGTDPDHEKKILNFVAELEKKATSK